MTWHGGIVIGHAEGMAPRARKDLAGLRLGDIKPRRDIDPQQGAMPQQRDLTLGQAAQHLAGMCVPNPSRAALEAHLGMIDAELERAEATGNISGAEHDLLRNYAMLALQGRPMPDDHRTPLVVDGQVVALLDDPDDGKVRHITFKLPAVVIERLRDAAAAMHPDRTISGLATVAIQQLLDRIEAALVIQAGQGLPRRKTDVLAGGRPQRLRQPAPADRPMADADKVQRLIITQLAEAGGSMRMGQLRTAAKISSPTLLAAHLKVLEAAGKVARGPGGVKLVDHTKRRRKQGKRG